MKTLTTVTTCAVVVALAQGPWSTAQGQSSSAADPVRIQRDIEVLAHDRWEGRGTCTPGLDSAAAFIARRFRDLRLAPAGSRDGAQGTAAFFHRYTARPGPHVAPAGVSSCASQNVVGVVRGSDPALSGEYVIVGAHYDHLGRNGRTALDPQFADSIRNGADDNASGTAGVLELARLFAARPGKRSIVFVTFSGEEWGTLGSQEFVRSGMPPGRVQAMVNFDMIGRLKNDRLVVMGFGSSPELRAIVERQNTGPAPFSLALNPAGNGGSDHASFHATLPVLHFFTDLHDDYHRASDDSPKINVPGEVRVIDYAARVIREIADGNALTFTVPVASPPSSAPASGRNAYLGSIPDMAAAETPGLRITGVTPGSPAAQGGLKANDIIVEFGGSAVTDLQSYSDALYSHAPGDAVKIVVVRAGLRVTLTVTLGRRGG